MIGSGSWWQVITEARASSALSLHCPLSGGSSLQPGWYYVGSIQSDCRAMSGEKNVSYLFTCGKLTRGESTTVRGEATPPPHPQLSVSYLLLMWTKFFCFSVYLVGNNKDFHFPCFRHTETDLILSGFSIQNPKEESHWLSHGQSAHPSADQLWPHMYVYVIQSCPVVHWCSGHSAFNLFSLCVSFWKVSISIHYTLYSFGYTGS